MYSTERAALTDFMAKSKKTQKQISKEIGLSTAVVSQFLSGTYTGDNNEVAQTINKYLIIGNERLNNVLSTRFYKDLYNTKEVLYAANYAHRHCDIVLVSGDSGAGKTTALKYYAENNAAVIFVTANACTGGINSMLTMICEKMKLPISNKNNVMMKALVYHLTNSNRLIVIDEADHLTLNALQAIRNLNDEAHVGIVLAGNEKLYFKMQRDLKFDQLKNRIAVRKRVCNDYETEEIKYIFQGLDDECVGFFLNLAGRECLRTAIKLFEIATGAAELGEHAITYKFLKKLQTEMMGVI